MPLPTDSSADGTSPEDRALQRWREFFGQIVSAGGPLPEEYPSLDRWFKELAGARLAGLVGDAEVQAILDSAGDATASLRTMQGFVRCKPHGYAGDFEVIDRIYTQWVSPDPSLEKWDRYFHAQAAVRAVRNRKAYFQCWLAAQEQRLGPEVAQVELLNLGSGPARDVLEYFERRPSSRVRCSCIDRDPRALAYAALVCATVRGKVVFHAADVLRYSPAVVPHLIWSAGLFDYLGDRIFVLLLRRWWRRLAPGGELAVGNFSRENPTRAYMEIGGWILQHRSADELVALARRAEIPSGCIHVAAEPERVNLFLHVTKREH